jgi:hypothetical protein
MTRVAVWLAAVFCAGSICAQVAQYRSPPEDLPRQLAPQPVKFSHRIHSEAKMLCVDCHKGVMRQAQAGLPTLGDCMLCHSAVASDKPEVQRLAALAAGGEKVQWERAYDVPDFVWFSHQQHLRADLGCESCHGPVKTRDVLAQERSLNMTACMNCHQQKGVSRECYLCHELGQ